ncbi:uncharacterized protein LOC122277065 [Carya illinoinensis]|uniref:uncharacterized protein LOC122277065 n=1 Tax=Carya illinoinensis TaxID=32201 RepID=UPI001C7292FF|nr:uncharacterized protein LOC122277065 [Carya illinoinensis]
MIEGTTWTLTGFYGHPKTEKRHESWSLLEALKPTTNSGWLCVGDFNEILHYGEKCGGPLRPIKQMEQFREAIDKCGLSDMGYSGSKFTWTNGRQGLAFMKERLDRAFCNGKWLELYTDPKVLTLPSLSSDHNPIWIAMDQINAAPNRSKRPFRFEASWTYSEDCYKVVEEAWKVPPVAGNIVNLTSKNLQHCQQKLTQWSKQKFGYSKKRIQDQLAHLSYLQDRNSGHLIDEIKKVQREVGVILDSDNMRWKQRAKQRWLREGDRNTKFFHQAASQRRKTNMVKKLVDSNDQPVTSSKGISEMFQSYFTDLFTSSNPSQPFNCISSLEARVSESQNESLNRPYCTQEVEEALFNMNGLSSPGPYGFPAFFYQKHWSIVGPKVCEAVLNVLNGKESMGSINNTLIALIPKKRAPTKVTEFRPISLCNVLYKLISKVIANRLKKVLPSVISVSQSAFVPNRLISDNIIVAFEALHTMKCRMAGREGYMALKLDMSKAYDRVEWCFLRAVLIKLGFGKKWVDLVMHCVETVNYSLLVNEALSNLICKAEEKELIHGVPVARGQVRVSHLFFADDSLLFCKANAEEWGRMVSLLRAYEMDSGQRLNVEKTSVVFSKNTNRITQRFILSIAGMRTTMPYERYLGLPLVVGKDRLKTFKTLLDSITLKLNSQRIKTLSQAGKKIYLKAVIQALPTFTMSVFKLPLTLIQAINSVIQRLGQSKAEGGLGFRDLEIFNKALLSKQCWRLIQDPSSLAAKVLKAKYFPQSSFQSAKVGSKPSFVWRSLLAARKTIEAGSFWRVGSGDKIHIWTDKWLAKTKPTKVTSPVRVLDGLATVAELIDPTTRSWKTELVKEIFEEGEAEVILQTPVSSMNSRDRLIWHGTKGGSFSVRSAYHMEKDREMADKGQASTSKCLKGVWNKLWHIRTAPSEKMFLWRACQDSLPTQLNLFKRKIASDPLCPLCCREEESTMHVLWNCEAAKDVWSPCSKKLQKSRSSYMPTLEFFEAMTEALNADEMQEFVVVARQLWLRRNSFIFNKPFMPPNILIRESKLRLDLLFEETQSQRQINVQQQCLSAEVWQAPPTAWFKVNWDAAVDRVKGLVGIGVVVRDDKGQTIATMRQSKSLFPDSLLAESFGALVATQFARDLGLTEVILEGDSLQVTRSLQGEVEDWSSSSMFLCEARTYLNLFAKWIVSHVRRNGNTVAHLLAKSALTISDVIITMEELPSCLSDLVQ